MNALTYYYIIYETYPFLTIYTCVVNSGSPFVRRLLKRTVAFEKNLFGKKFKFDLFIGEKKIELNNFIFIFKTVTEII